MHKLIQRLLIATGLAMLVSACGGGGGGDAGGPSAPVTVATITVAPGAVTLNRGESTQLGATLKDSSGKVLDGRSVTWTSADPSKVSVTATGRIEAISAGRVDVTATAGGKSARAEVTVVEPAAPVSRVELNTVLADVEEGDSLQLEATAYDGDGNVLNGRGEQWVSGDAGTVAVSASGLVTGLRPGTVTVTVRIDGGQASATVRVFANYDFGLIYSKADAGLPYELYTLDIGDPEATALSAFGAGKRASHAAPSPDGLRIAFVVHGQWDATSWQSMIYVADRDGSNPSRVTFLPARNDQPVWSPDGTRIAFRSQPAGAGSDIWVMNADGSDLLNVTADQQGANKSSPAWSPRLADGSHRIAYAAAQGGSSHLWTMRADGGDKRQVTSDANFHDDEPAWSPDGGTLVFQRSGAAVFGDLYLVSSTGGAGRALLPANPLAFGQFSPAWSPDGRLIAFTSKHGGGDFYQVWTVWADGTRLAQRTRDLQEHADPAWITLP
jgi:Tol biopolymer transport system component